MIEMLSIRARHKNRNPMLVLLRLGRIKIKMAIVLKTNPIGPTNTSVQNDKALERLFRKLLLMTRALNVVVTTLVTVEFISLI